MPPWNRHRPPCARRVRVFLRERPLCLALSSRVRVTPWRSPSRAYKRRTGVVGGERPHPGQFVELGRFFRRVTSTVLSTTNPQQEPFMYGRLPDEDFYFKPPK